MAGAVAGAVVSSGTCGVSCGGRVGGLLAVVAGFSDLAAGVSGRLVLLSGGGAGFGGGLVDGARVEFGFSKIGSMNTLL